MTDVMKEDLAHQSGQLFLLDATLSFTVEYRTVVYLVVYYGTYRTLPTTSSLPYYRSVDLSTIPMQIVFRDSKGIDIMDYDS